MKPDYRERNKPITAEDLIRRYNFENISKAMKAIQSNKNGLDKTNTIMNEFIEATIENIQELQDQVDGNITTWFYSGVPTLLNEPASDWNTDEEKANHLGDLYYDQNTGYAYRFQMVNGEFSWYKLTDTDVTEALAIANAAQDTADSKRRVFVSTPTPPYDVGDIWLKDDSELYRCRTKRTSGNYSATDWIIGTKYTDDSYAMSVEAILNQFKSFVETTYATKALLETTADSINARVETNASKIEQIVKTTNETDESNPVELIDAEETNLAYYRINGNHNIKKYEGYQLYNINNVNQFNEDYQIDDNGWITLKYNNTSGTTKFFNLYTFNLDLEINTEYAIFLEVRNKAGSGILRVISTDANLGQFTEKIDYNIADISSAAIYKEIRRTRSSFDNSNDLGLRTYFYCQNGQSGEISFRISVLGDTSITINEFNYEPYIYKKKNLLNALTMVKGRLDNGVIGYSTDTSELIVKNDSFKFTTTKNYRGVVSDYIKVSSSSVYTISNSNQVFTSSFRPTISCYNSTKTYLGEAYTSAVGNKNIRFTILANTKYVRVYFYLSSAGTIEVKNPQIEAGPSKTGYEPYLKSIIQKPQKIRIMPSIKNLFDNPYTENNKLVDTATRDDYYVITNYYVELDKNKSYVFSCKTDGTFGDNGARDQQIFLLKDKQYDFIYEMKSKDGYVFQPMASGKYYLRYDVNNNGQTRSFWDFQIEEFENWIPINNRHNSLPSSFKPKGIGMSVKKTGKNLFEPYPTISSGISGVLNDDNSIHVSGTTTTTWANITTEFVNMEIPKGKYTLSISDPKSYAISVRFYYVDRTYTNIVLTPGQIFKTFELIDDTNICYAYIYGFQAGTEINDTLSIQIEKSEEPTEIEIFKQKNYYLNFETSNKFDKNNFNELDAYIAASSPNQIISSNGDKIIYIPCKPNSTYTISKKCQDTPINNRFRVGTTSSKPDYNMSVDNFYWNLDTERYSSEIKYTTNSDAKYLVVYTYLKNNETTYEEMLSSVCIKENDDIQLLKDDYIYFKDGRWYSHKEWGKAILTGNENWISPINGSDYTIFQLNNSNIKEMFGFEPYYNLDSTQTDNVACEKLININGTETYMSQNEGISLFSEWLRISVSNIIAENIDEFKSWLNKNNLLVYIKLQNPIEMELSKENYPGLYDEFITAYDGYNLITAEDSLVKETSSIYYLKTPLSDIYVTKSDMNSSLNMTSNEIVASTSQKIQDSYTKGMKELSAVSDNLNGKIDDTNATLQHDYYTKETTETLIMNSATGITNTFSEAGGNNLLRNTNFYAKDVLELGQMYEYWYGKVEKMNNNNSANGVSILLQNGTLKQQQVVANTEVTLSFTYRKTNDLATCYVKINGKQYELTSTNYTLFQTGVKNVNGEYITEPVIISDNHLDVEFITNINNSCEIYDIMVNYGSVKLAYSQNQNETITDTVNISRGMTIETSTSDVKFVANNNGIKTKNKITDETITEFTDKGTTTNEILVKNQATIVGILRQKVGDQVWDSLI